MDSTVLGVIIGVILVALTVALIFLGRGKEKPSEEEIPAAADDLAILEGIGPKIAEILKKNGIATFGQLGAATPADLERILRANGMPYAKPASWPKQARLAAAGKMEELKQLQESLVAGR
jgi:large subunit ribosomal protein L17